MSLTPLPTPPSRNDPANFTDRADAFLGALPQFGSELNTLQSDLMPLNAGMAAIIAAANYKGLWTALSGALAIPASTYHLGAFWTLLENVANVATEVPGTSSKWVRNEGAQTFQQDFRLSLTSGLAVTTADVTGATTIYCVPYKGKSISLYTAAGWVIRQSAQFSLALGTLSSGLPYDVFCYDNAGVPTLELAAWTNGTTRATALVYQDGVLCKSGALTRRYLGTFYTTATTTTEDSARRRLLWNYYNRVARPLVRNDSAGSWAYTTAAFRQANANALNQIEIVSGVAEDSISVRLALNAQNTTGGVQLTAVIGVNTLSGAVATHVGGTQTTPPAVAGATVTINDNVEQIPAAGFNYYAWLEFSQATGTTTWIGSSVSGISARWAA